MNTLTIPQRVANGVIVLDRDHPGWIDRIDLDELHMNTACRCILGQAFGDYFDAPIGGTTNPEMERADLGFQSYVAVASAQECREIDTHPGERVRRDAEYRALEAEWRRVIEARRAGLNDPEGAR
jgi:hypothetical protein